VYALEDEPDVKRGPGGLRDLQRALWANACASARSMPLKPSRLVQAHRFLWQVRCHLHLLAGRAEDRLSRSLQPGIARRLGLLDSRGPTARPLLDLFRYHARNIVAAIESAPRPSARLLSNSHWDIAATKQTWRDSGGLRYGCNRFARTGNNAVADQA
jgi:UTP:GlnB (protein PII) uridylyltransferase